jgi:hypothetical protein
MNKAVNKLALAVAFTCAAVASIIGATRGMNIGELASMCGIIIVVLFMLVRTIGGYYAMIITRKLAELRAERAARHLLDP